MENATQLSDAQFGELVKDNVSNIVRDPELRKLKPGSEEFKAGVVTKFHKKEEAKTPAKSAPADTTQKADENSGQSEGLTSTPETKKDEQKAPEITESTQKRFDRLTWEKKEALEKVAAKDSRIAELERALEEAKKGIAPQTKAPQSTELAKDEPNPVDYKGDSLKYMEDKAAWLAEQAVNKYVQSIKGEEVQKTKQTKIQTYLEKGKEMEGKLGLSEGEFKILAEDPRVRFWPEVQERLLDSPFGAEIGIGIARGDDEFVERWNKMTSLQQASYISKLEGKLEATQESEPKNLQKGDVKPSAEVSPKMPKGKGGIIGTNDKPYLNADGSVNHEKFRKWRKGQ
jgi:hypothetical protein